MTKIIYTKLNIYSHPFGGVEEAEFWFWEAEELPLVFYKTTVGTPHGAPKKWELQKVGSSTWKGATKSRELHVELGNFEMTTLTFHFIEEPTPVVKGAGFAYGIG